MTECRTEEIRVPDGSELRLTIVEPESVVRGGIVVFPEARGVTDAVRKLADGLADDGWLALIPHLYHPDSAGEPAGHAKAEQVSRHLECLSADSVLNDADASFGWLADQGVSTDQIGVVGFGLGGTVALIIATQRDLGAAVTVDGIGVAEPACPALPAMVEAAPQLRCPWLGVYRRNGVVTPDEVHKLQDAACTAQVATDLVLFADTDRFRAVPAGVEAWTRLLNWFDSHLR